MVKIFFENAVVRDDGFGLQVNGKSLEDIISTALGTKLGNNGGFKVLSEFESNCCDITLTIVPHDTKALIVNDENTWTSVEEMEEARKDEYEKVEKTGPKE